MGTVMHGQSPATPPDISNKWRIDKLEADYTSTVKTAHIAEYDSDWKLTGANVTVRAETLSGLLAVAKKLGAVDA